ncbi:ATP-binding protein [Metabacillus sp. HB246100]|uniref:ATP-binding protein n=1 Tax=Bacillus weihaiensis TaxID=1547283 RepID=UPI002352C490|nr:ATP-binding protein [Bacillus weihaiensis]
MLNKYMKTSLAKQFSLLTATIILAFTCLIASLLIYQNKLTTEFEKVNSELEEKQDTVYELDYAFNLAISEMRALFAYGSLDDSYKATYLENVMLQKDIVKDKIQVLNGMSLEEDGRLFLENTDEFYEYYFENLVPKSIDLFEQGKLEEVSKIATSGENASAKIRDFQSSLQDYSTGLEEKVETNFYSLQTNTLYSQIAFAIALFLLIVGMVIFTRMMLVKIGKPLRKLTIAAREIAEGESVLFTDTTNRQDELGLLSIAFEKMTKSIQDKEQDLNAQNEELLAQQDELQAQQAELEEALETTQNRELDLKRRNDLVKGIANSLDKQEVLSSIVKTMCEVIDADKGIVVMLDKSLDHASFGISKIGKEQFLKHLQSGLIVRLQETKKPYSVQRESSEAEMAFHTTKSYCYDLYLPVLSGLGKIEAVLMYSRFSRPFTEIEIMEYEALTKQVAISLDKIKMYEHSERERVLVQDILDTIKEGIQLVDSKGSVIQINKKLCDMVDCHSQTFIDSSYETWIEKLSDSVKNKLEFKAFFQRVLVEGKGEEASFIYHQEEPLKRVVQVYCEPLRRDGEKVGTVIVHRDITKEYEVDLMKSEFVSTVSHELRTPLASVLGFTELMLNKELKPDRQKKYLTTIYQEAKRLTALINDFLDVQRMEAGKQTYDKKYDDILPLLTNIVETTQINTPNHQITLDVATHNTMVLGDRDKIGQVFNNLISNAIKYSPDGGQVEINVFEEGSNLKIEVKDEGLGIPPDAIDKLFTKFYRVDNSDRRRIGGTGLGLAIVKEIMKAHEGEIDVQSKIKEGSTFTVSFPLVIGMYDSSRDTEQKDGNEKEVNVIIVEDDSSLANLLKTELEESHFNVKTFNEGETALKAIKQEHPDAIVLDIMLKEKGIDGWEIIRQLKEIEELKSIPIFISSALDEKEKGLALGANEYLVKPYQPSKLSKLILQTLLKKDWSGQILVPSKSYDE